MLRDNKIKLSPITIVLHWSVTLLVIGLIALGSYMEDNKAFELYSIHKSFGILLFGFVVVRVLWRINSGWLQPVGAYSKIEQLLAKVVHWLLMIAIVLMPVSGMMFSISGGHGLVFFGFEIVAPNFDASGKAIVSSKLLAGVGHEIHHFVGEIIIPIIALHVVGALKHHFIDQDNTLKRMLGKVK